MNAKYLEEIKARLADADIADDWDCVNSGLVYQDIPALLAEVERLQEECSTLEKALEPACRSIATAYGKYYDPYATTEEREKLLPQLMHYFIQQAQEQEEANKT